MSYGQPVCEYCHQPAVFATSDLDYEGDRHPQVCALHLGDWLKNDLPQSGHHEWKVTF